MEAYLQPKLEDHTKLQGITTPGPVVFRATAERLAGMPHKPPDASLWTPLGTAANQVLYFALTCHL
jgi:hypothetical protein